jgi:hypothetical protein
MFTDEEVEEVMKSDGYFPLLCKLFSRYQKRGVSFFENPYEIVIQEIETFRSSDKRKY